MTTCSGAQWGTCDVKGGEVKTHAIEGGGLHFASFGSGSACGAANPCDPYCKQIVGGGVCGGPQICVGGKNDGESCKDAGDCKNPGVCTAYVGVCVLGGNDANPCLVAADCPGGSCTPGNGHCDEGSRDENLCVVAAQCPGGSCKVAACSAGVGLCDGGLCLSGEGGSSAGSCTGLTIAPATTTITVTSLTASPPPVAYTATFTPAGCAPAGTQPTWVVDRPDLAVIDVMGNLTLFGSVAGTNLMTVKAFFGALSASASVSVNVKVVAAVGPDVAPNGAAAPGQVDKFYADPGHTMPGVPAAPSDASWLYPYADTFFPRGLPAPVVQYLMGGNPGNTVKVTLRFPSGSTAATALFDYSLLTTEKSVVYPTAPTSTKDPQVVIPQVAWRGFEQTAKGADADIIIQRWAAGSLQNENPRRVHFVDAQLKGSVFYSSYSSPLAGNTGAVMRIAPGATSPTVAVQPGGKCTVCHSINLDGSRLIANDGVGGAYPGDFNQSKRYDMTTASPSPAVLQSYPYTGGAGDQDATGDKFTYGAPYMDGRLYMSHGGTSGSGDKEWRSPPGPSSLFDPANPAVAKVVTGWPNNVQGVTPRFSPDGTKLAFGFWGGNALAQSPAGTLASDATGHSLAVVDFTCGAGCASGWTVSNARNLTPGVTEKVGWPTVTPDSTSVAYQRQYLSSKARLAWDPGDINSVAGALSELWISRVPADSTTAAVPTRMNALNGLTPGGVSYLPQVARTLAPAPAAYHTNNSSYLFYQADNCGKTGTAINVYDYRLNYYPSFMPRESGGYNWVVFSSRRMYGNIAYDNPWDAEPGQGCSSGTPPTKKLWIAAVEKTWVPGTDPSHPAFLLPGQELAAGNSSGFWVDAPCGAPGASCDTNADCCQTPSAESCRIDVGSGPPVTRTCRLSSACVVAGSACTVDADCCGSPAVKCLGAVCAAPQNLAPASFTLEYKASCAVGTCPAWGYFSWQSIIPGGTSIDFSAQTAPDVAGAPGAYGPQVPVGSATATTASWTWDACSVDGHLQNLAAATPPQPACVGVPPPQRSLPWLQVSMKLNPNAAVSPVMTKWRQMYDCLPCE